MISNKDRFVEEFKRMRAAFKNLTESHKDTEEKLSVVVEYQHGLLETIEKVSEYNRVLAERFSLDTEEGKPFTGQVMHFGNTNLVIARMVDANLAQCIILSDRVEVTEDQQHVFLRSIIVNISDLEEGLFVTPEQQQQMEMERQMAAMQQQSAEEMPEGVVVTTTMEEDPSMGMSGVPENDVVDCEAVIEDDSTTVTAEVQDVEACADKDVSSNCEETTLTDEDTKEE